MQLASQEAEATDHSAHTEAHRLLPLNNRADCHFNNKCKIWRFLDTQSIFVERVSMSIEINGTY